MREILFKAKTVSGNWVNGLLANIGDKWYISNKAGRLRTRFVQKPSASSQGFATNTEIRFEKTIL